MPPNEEIYIKIVFVCLNILENFPKNPPSSINSVQIAIFFGDAG